MSSLYREEIIDHFKYPRNEGEINDPDVEIDETNSSCGDKIRLQLKLDKDDNIHEVKFLCHGCVISKAASSMLTEAIKDKKLSQVKDMSLEDMYKLLGGPVALGRVSCASLGLKALHKAAKMHSVNNKKE
jgi:nitrogen fixation protein NifU and related proteins